MDPKSLTQHLSSLAVDQFKAATQHDFLAKAGAGTLSAKPLCRWLVQDKYYQFAYVRFIGRLISKIDLTSFAFVTEKNSDNLPWKTLQSLTGALNAIKDEIEFYNSTAEKYDLHLDREGPNEITQQYVRLFEESSAVGKPVIWGLVVLWATEYCYLKAWTYAKEQSPHNAHDQDFEGAVAALHKEFIPNWTSDGFKAAVDALAEVANLWAATLETGEEGNCEKFWLKTLELEAKFWPDV